MTIRAIIVDDEPLARARLRRLLGKHDDVDVVAECGDATSAIAAIAGNRPDVVFLDISMPGQDGFEVVNALPDALRPAVVFVTAYDEHAVQAFGVDAADYLLKPFGADRVAETLRRIRKRTESNRPTEEVLRAVEEFKTARDRLERLLPQDSPPAETGFLSRIPVKVDGSTRLITIASVDYFQSNRNTVTLHVGADQFVFREPLSKVEPRLDPARFVRIHRQTIVNIARVQEIEPGFSGDAVVTLAGRQRLRLSRKYRAALERILSARS